MNSNEPSDAINSNECSGDLIPTELLRATKKVKNKDTALTDGDDLVMLEPAPNKPLFKKILLDNSSTIPRVDVRMPLNEEEEGLVRALASVIGNVVKVDYNTIDETRGKFARVAVVVDISKPLVPFIDVDRKKQTIVYESLPSICYTCGKSTAVRNDGRPANQAKGASSSQRFAALSVLNPEDSLQEPTTFLPNPLQEASGYPKAKKGKENQTLSLEPESASHSVLNNNRFMPYPKTYWASVQVPNKQADLLAGPSGSSRHANKSKLDNTTVLFKPGSEYPKEVVVQLTEGILDPGKHFVVTFKEILNSIGRTKSRHSEPLETNSPGSKERKISSKIGVSHGGKKPNIAMRGRDSCLKALINTRVSLADTVEEMVNLILTKLTNEKDTELHDESDPSDTSEPQH
ncbi:hypothetical protein Goarm_020188 [Gossypium armourianum]|uniref:Uncharacterized protein n=1 Tax=Gossypium armourianum TaxID=34283 RepID=A0A7J9INT6_9ROSI|nr:hypothetical protein [Gossypium armourianum]